jgi:hypothetical protein
MKIRFVTYAEGSGWGKVEFDSESAAVAVGHVVVGRNTPRSCQRVQLHDAPRFDGYLGPMWDGDALRYESSEAYAVLSS